MLRHVQQLPAVASQTLTASGASASFQTPSGDSGRQGLAYLVIAGPVSGTSPSLTVSIQGSPDGTNWATLASFAAQTAATAAGVAIRLALSQVLEPFVRVSYTISGTTPSFGGVSVTLFFSDDEG